MVVGDEEWYQDDALDVAAWMAIGTASVHIT